MTCFYDPSMQKSYMGIDPGASGAIAVYDGDELIIHDMPFYEIKKGKTMRKKVDFNRLCAIIEQENPTHVYIENVSAQFGNGAAAAFSFGWACACVENAVIAAGAPYTYVTPQIWKKTMGCPADKDAARQRASQLMPQFAHNWERRRDHNRAESALLSLYGFNKELK